MGDASTIPLLEDRVQKNSYDVEAWQMLVDELWNIRQAPGIMEKLRSNLQAIVAKYPSAGKFWKMLVDFELDKNNLEGAISLFSECLLNCYHVPLWLSYMRFIKMSNANKANDDGHMEVMKAYDYVLDRLGHDSAAGVLWQEYITFMSDFAPSSSAFRRLFEPEIGKEASKRALRLRELYQKAMLVPGAHLEALWPAYEHFETASAGRNNLAAQRFIDEARPRYKAASEAWVVRSGLLAALDRDALPQQPGKSPPCASFAVQCDAWKAFITYEKANKQGLDNKLQRNRVDLAYQQALQPLGGCPDLWCEWAEQWREYGEEFHNSHQCDALKKACVALPDCVMLSFALADALHAAKKPQDAVAVYDGLVDRIEKGTGEAAFSPEAGNSVWLQSMHFQHRVANNALEAQDKCRRIFMKVFACHALMEWSHRNQSQGQAEHGKSVHIVKGIFELGLKSPHVQCVPEYVREYANWLILAAGDVNNARIVFKNAVANEEVYRSPEIWNYFMEFESQYGNVHEMLAVDTQRRVALKDKIAPRVAMDSLLMLCTRYKSMGLWPCTKEQKSYIHSLQGIRFDGTNNMSSQLTIFIEKLPKTLEHDQPVPDVEYVIDILLNSTHPEMGGQLNGSRGVKRPPPSMQDSSTSHADLFTFRQKMKHTN